MKFSANGVFYEFDETKLSFVEAKAMQKATKRTIADLSKTVAEDAESMQAFFWVAMKRQDPTLTYLDLDDMPISDIQWDGDGEDEDEEEGDAEPDPPVLDAEPHQDSTPSG